MFAFVLMPKIRGSRLQCHGRCHSIYRHTYEVRFKSFTQNTAEQKCNTA